MNKKALNIDIGAGVYVKLRYLFAFIFALLVIINSELAEASQSDDPWDKANFKQDWSHRLVSNVLFQLRNIAKQKGNTRLVKLLARTRIAVPRQSMYKESPNAYAYINKQQDQWIIIEDRWMKQVAGLSELGALFAIAEAGWGFKEQNHGLFREYCAVYKQTFAQNVNTKQAVVFQFKIEDFYSRADPQNSGFFATYDKVSGITFASAIAWTVLHEVAHHDLEHTKNNTKKNPVSNEVKRANELAADNWAFQRMEELGYSLYPLGAYFLAREWVESCVKPLGLVVNETDSTHPLWYTRGTELYENFDWRLAARQNWRVYFIPLGSKDGRSSFITITINDQSKNNPQATIIQSGRAVPAIAEWNQGRVVVYVRDADRGRFEYIISNPLKVMVSVEEQYFNAKNQLSGSIKLFAIQQDMANLGFLKIDGLSFSDIQDSVDQGDSWKRRLRRLGISANASSRARARRDRYTIAKNALDSKYMKGQMSMAIYVPQFTGLTGNYEKDLISILGKGAYKALKAEVTKEVKSYASFLFKEDTEWEKNLIIRNLGQ